MVTGDPVSEPEPPLTDMQRRIRAVLEEHPDGLDIKEIRDLLGLGDEQQHLDRRVRSLKTFYTLPRRREGRRYVYRLGTLRPASEWTNSAISGTQRARILNRDGRRCQMCGKTVAEDHVRLHVDHKIPSSWGGTDDDENLWALCSQCNEGKRAHFASLDGDEIADILEMDSVHARLAHMLKASEGEWVDSEILAFVANFKDYQEDWHKRLRELRYLGVDYEVKRWRDGRKVRTKYRLTKWTDLPEDPSRAAREYEAERARRNRNS